MDLVFFGKIAVVYAYILGGFLFGWALKQKNVVVKQGIAKTLINFVVPVQFCLVILTSEAILSIGHILLISLLAATLYCVQWYLGGVLFRRNDPDLPLLGAELSVSAYPNSLYFLVPIILQAFSEDLLLIPVIYASTLLFIRSTLLPAQIQRLTKHVEPISLLKVFKNIFSFPPFIGVFTGLLLLLIPIDYSTTFLMAVKTPVSTLTSATSGIVIGMGLVGLQWPEIPRYARPLLHVAAVRFGMGLAVFALLTPVLRFGDATTPIRTILLLIACAPPGQNNMIYCLYFGFDEKFTASAITLLTLVGLALMPAILGVGLWLL